jgi:PAS domain S-box-containing protein
MRNLSRRAIFVAAGLSCAIVVLGAVMAISLDRNAAVVGGALAGIGFIFAVAMLLLRQVRVSQELAGEAAAWAQRLNAVIESAMDAIITIDRNHRIILFNNAAERMFGCPARGTPGMQAIGAQLDRFIPDRFRGRHRDHIERFSRTGVSMRRMGEKISLFGLRAGGEEFPIDASISQVEVGGEKYYTVILRDVTAQHQAERQLLDSEARLNAIIGSAMDAIITVDERQNIMLFNAAAEKIFCCPSNEAVGSPLDRFIPLQYRDAHRGHIERFGRTGVTMRRMGENIVLAGLRTDGEEFPIDASISQVTVGGRRFYTVILRDITERQKSAAQIEASHRELRELYGVMNEVREAERIRIARELHDELAQWLTALKMDVSWVAARLPKGETRLAEKTGKMKEVVDATVAAVRRIAADLRPVMIDDLGLVPAIEHLLHEFSQRTGILVSLDTQTEGIEFRDPVATAVYRMVQEALTNVARHAEASRVQVSLEPVGELLAVTVRDNGRGIDEEQLRKAKSYGVLGIRERAQTLGGNARVYRAREGGTIVEITIPMRAQKREERAA